MTQMQKMQNVVTFFAIVFQHLILGILALLLQFPQRDKLTHQQHECKITLQSVVHAHDQFILHEPKTRKFFKKCRDVYLEPNLQFFKSLFFNYHDFPIIYYVEN